LTKEPYKTILLTIGGPFQGCKNNLIPLVYNIMTNSNLEWYSRTSKVEKPLQYKIKGSLKWAFKYSSKDKILSNDLYRDFQ